MSASEAQPAVQPDDDWRARVPKQKLWRRVLPFVIAIALLAYVIAPLKLDKFRDALLQLDVAPFLGFAVAYTLGLLAVDSLASIVIYRPTAPQLRFGPFFVIRAASYLPGLVNHHLGQAFLTYMAARACKVPVARLAGSTLLSYAGWMGCLLGLATVALPLAHQPAAWLIAPLGGGVVYLIILALKPARLTKLAFLQPLFEAGLKGHFIAVVTRIPHLSVLVVGLWMPLYLFDVKVPVGPALLFIPVVLIVTTLPFTPPGGFGTRDALCKTFFLVYAAGATVDDQAARVAACTATWAVAQTLVTALVAVACTRWAARLAAPESAAPAVAAAG